MTEGIRTIIYPVKDIGQATKFYGKLLGVEPYVSEPYYVAFTVGDQDVGLDPTGHTRGMNGPVSYWHVADVRQTIGELVDAGAQLLDEARDVGGGKLIASVKDADGNTIGLIEMPR